MVMEEHTMVVPEILFYQIVEEDPNKQFYLSFSI